MILTTTAHKLQLAARQFSFELENGILTRTPKHRPIFITFIRVDFFLIFITNATNVENVIFVCF